MAGQIKRPCSWPGCRTLIVEGGRCDRHRAETRRAVDDRRGSAASRGYGHRWRLARAQFLRQHPLCAEHLARGDYVAATDVDHIEPHRGDRRLFWDRRNWQSLCGRCHKSKSGREAHD